MNFSNLEYMEAGAYLLWCPQRTGTCIDSPGDIGFEPLS